MYQTSPPFEQVLATPIKKTSLNNDHKNLDNVIQLNNYNNVYLEITDKKLRKIEDRITHSSTSIKKENNPKTPLFISHEIHSHLVLPLNKSTTDTTQR